MFLFICTDTPIDEFKDYDDITNTNQNGNTGYPMSLDYSYPSNELVTSPSIRIMNNNNPNPHENNVNVIAKSIKSKNVQPSISSLMKLSDLRKIYNVPKPILKKKYHPRRKNKPPSRYIYYKN